MKRLVIGGARWSEGPKEEEGPSKPGSGDQYWGVWPRVGSESLRSGTGRAESRPGADSAESLNTRHSDHLHCGGRGYPAPAKCCDRELRSLAPGPIISRRCGQTGLECCVGQSGLIPP